MSKKNKTDKRKEKLKARKRQESNISSRQIDRLSSALSAMCAPVLPEYIDDSDGIDIVGRKIVYQMGQIAWNIALSGRMILDDSDISLIRLGESERQIFRDEIAGLILRKNTLFPNIRTSINSVKVIIGSDKAGVKVKPGQVIAIKNPTVEMPPLPPEPLMPEQIFAMRKDLSLSQVKLGEMLQVSARTISAWEHGKASPADEQMQRLRELAKKDNSL